MSTITTYMSLTAWTEPDDPYDHTELANNFNKLDGHRHIPGEGRQLVTASYTDHSVTEIKLAQPAVNTDNYVDGSITIDKLAPGILNAIVPLGIVVPWWAPTSGASPVYGAGTLFELCDGHTLTDHDLPGGGTITLPNLLDKFLYFGLLANVGVVGGAINHLIAFAHSHTVNAHSHAVDPHSHTVNAHSHTQSDHTHGISGDGDHRHRFNQNFGTASPVQYVDAASRPVQKNTLSETERRQALYVPGFNDGDTSATIPMEATGAHSHGGATGGMSGGGATGSASPGTTAASPGTSSASPGTNSVLGSVDIRPRYATLVPVMRVRNSV